MFRIKEKKMCVITFSDENEVPRVTEPTDIVLTISDCTTIITYSDLEIESC